MGGAIKPKVDQSTRPQQSLFPTIKKVFKTLGLHVNYCGFPTVGNAVMLIGGNICENLDNGLIAGRMVSSSLVLPKSKT